MRSPQLKPCPFCGGRANLFHVPLSSGSVVHEVDCENDDCRVSVCTQAYDTPEEAAAAWNRRAPCLDDSDEKRFSGLIAEE